MGKPLLLLAWLVLLPWMTLRPAAADVAPQTREHILLAYDVPVPSASVAALAMMNHTATTLEIAGPYQTGVAFLTSVQGPYQLFANHLVPQLDDLVGSYMLGIATIGAAQHLLIFGSSTFANGAAGSEFQTLFSAADEAALIEALNTAYGDGVTPSTGDKANADGLLTTFDSSYGAALMIAPPTGRPGAAIGTLAFSTATLVGTGEAFLQVPEPMTLSLLGAGVAGLVSLRRRRR